MMICRQSLWFSHVGHGCLELGPAFKGHDKNVSRSASSVSMIGWGKRFPMGPVVDKSRRCFSEAESCLIISANAAADTEGFSFSALNKCTMARPTQKCCELLMLIQAPLGGNVFSQITCAGRL